MVPRLTTLLLLAACTRGGPSLVARPTAAGGGDLACVGGTVIPGPDAPAIPDAVVLITGGRIAAVAPRTAAPALPPGIARLPCQGTVVLAGFWNSHVHLIGPAWQGSASAPAAQLEAALDDLFLRWGFVHVVDTGSFPQTTFPLRRRIESGEIRGPRIVTAAGSSFVAVGGQPVYLPVRLPELAEPAAATRLTAEAIQRGADAIKVFTASVVARPPPPVMPPEVVRAVVAEAHRRGVRVLAHPTTAGGVRAAVDGGVDVLAHTAPEDGPWPPELIARMRASGIALVPTLQLWSQELRGRARLLETFQVSAVTQVRDFAAAGGRLLFGTDVGYLAEHDPGEEYRLLAWAGLGFPEILAMLTTAPAGLWGGGQGRVVPGEDGDLVILDRDPRQDPTAWTAVRFAVRRGVVLHGPPAGARSP